MLPTITLTIAGQSVQLRVDRSGKVLTSSFLTDMPESAARLTFGHEPFISLAARFELVTDLVELVLPLWRNKVATPDFAMSLIDGDPEQLRYPTGGDFDRNSLPFQQSILRTFNKFGASWYRFSVAVAEVLKALIPPTTNWPDVTYALRDGNRFFEPVINLLLKQVQDDDRRARLWVILLKHPPQSVAERLMPFLQTFSLGSTAPWVLHLAANLDSVDDPILQRYRTEYLRLVRAKSPKAVLYYDTELTDRQTWLLLLDELNQNSSTISTGDTLRRTFRHGRFNLKAFTDIAELRSDWTEIRLLFRTDLLAKGFPTDNLPDVDSYVTRLVEGDLAYMSLVDTWFLYDESDFLRNDQLAPTTIHFLMETLKGSFDDKVRHAALLVFQYLRPPLHLCGQENEPALKQWARAPRRGRPLFPPEISSVLFRVIDAPYAYDKSTVNVASFALSIICLYPTYRDQALGELTTRAQAALAAGNWPLLAVYTHVLLPAYRLLPGLSELRPLLLTALRNIPAIAVATWYDFPELQLAAINDPDITHTYLQRLTAGDVRDTSIPGTLNIFAAYED